MKILTIITLTFIALTLSEPLIFKKDFNKSDQKFLQKAVNIIQYFMKNIKQLSSSAKDPFYQFKQNFLAPFIFHLMEKGQKMETKCQAKDVDLPKIEKEFQLDNLEYYFQNSIHSNKNEKLLNERIVKCHGNSDCLVTNFKKYLGDYLLKCYGDYFDEELKQELDIKEFSTYIPTLLKQPENKAKVQTPTKHYEVKINAPKQAEQRHYSDLKVNQIHPIQNFEELEKIASDEEKFKDYMGLNGQVPEFSGWDYPEFGKLINRDTYENKYYPKLREALFDLFKRDADTILESIGDTDDQIMERKIMLILLRLQTSTQFSMIYLSQDPSKCILPTIGAKYHYKTYAMTDKFSKVLSKSFCKQNTLTKQDIDKVIKEMMQKIRFNE